MKKNFFYSIVVFLFFICVAFLIWRNFNVELNQNSFSPGLVTIEGQSPNVDEDTFDGDDLASNTSIPVMDVREASLGGNFFKVIKLDDSTVDLLASKLQVDAESIEVVDVNFRALNGFKLSEVFEFDYKGESVELYITKIVEVDGIKSIMGRLSHADPGFYFDLSFDLDARAVDGVVMTYKDIYEVNTLYGVTVISAAPERIID